MNTATAADCPKVGDGYVTHNGLGHEKPFRKPVFRHVGNPQALGVLNAAQLHGLAPHAQLAARDGPQANECHGQLGTA